MKLKIVFSLLCVFMMSMASSCTSTHSKSTDKRFGPEQPLQPTTASSLDNTEAEIAGETESKVNTNALDDPAQVAQSQQDSPSLRSETEPGTPVKLAQSSVGSDAGNNAIPIDFVMEFVPSKVPTWSTNTPSASTVSKLKRSDFLTVASSHGNKVPVYEKKNGMLLVPTKQGGLRWMRSFDAIVLPQDCVNVKSGRVGGAGNMPAASGAGDNKIVCG